MSYYRLFLAIVCMWLMWAVFQHVLLPLQEGGRKRSSPHATEKPCSICFPISVTSFSTGWSKYSDSVLATTLLPSFLQHASPSCSYAFYYGYDRGDFFYSNPSVVADLKEAFTMHPQFNVSVKVFEYDDTASRNVWAVNYLTEECYLDGYEYIFRINDDSEFAEPFAEKLVKKMRHEAVVPDFGVVGLEDPDMKRIFTHDFVSRTHFKVFRTHYPWVFHNWWSDDWITFVYGPIHTQRTNIRINHKRLARRYGVDQSIEAKLNSALAEGRLAYRTWLRMPREADHVGAEEMAEDRKNIKYCGSDLGRGSARDRMIACMRRKYGCREHSIPPMLLHACSATMSYDFLFSRSFHEIRTLYKTEFPPSQ